MSSSAPTLQQLVTPRELERAIDTLQTELQHNILNGDTCVRVDGRREIASVETRLLGRYNDTTAMMQQVIEAINELSLARQREFNRAELLQRRVTQLEASTWRARTKRWKATWRAFVAELGGRWTYTDEELDEQTTQALIELYRHPTSTPSARQDARHVS